MRIKKPESHHEASFTFPVLSDYRVFIIFTEDFAKTATYLADRDFFNVLDSDEKYTNCVACHLHPNGRGHSYLLFKPKAHAGAIAHECWHMIYQLMEWTAIKPDDEFVAYHLGHAVQKVVEFQHDVQRRITDADSGGSGPKAGAGRVGRSRGDSSKPKDQGSVGVHGTPKVRRSKTRTRQTDR